MKKQVKIKSEIQAVRRTRPNLVPISVFTGVGIIDQAMLWRIPTSEAEVETTNTGAVLVYDHNLLVMRPELDVVLATNVVGVTHDGDVWVKCLKGLLRVVGTHGHGLRDLLVDDNVNLDTLLGFALQNSVDTPFRVLGRRSAQV